jgi:uncharacterized protein
MRIAVDHITESPKEARFSEDMEEVNRLFEQEGTRDFRFPPFLDVNLVYYRSGQEIFFKGRFRTAAQGCCGRCLECYSLLLEKEFDFILTPEPLAAKGRELNRDELGLSFYTAKEINLSPLIREQLLLALPMQPLCNEGCRGLCPGCGVNLNAEPCLCPTPDGDPRTAFFRALRFGR